MPSNDGWTELRIWPGWWWRDGTLKSSYPLLLLVDLSLIVFHLVFIQVFLREKFLARSSLFCFRTRRCVHLWQNSLPLSLVIILITVATAVCLIVPTISVRCMYTRGSHRHRPLPAPERRRTVVQREGEQRSLRTLQSPSFPLLIRRPVASLVVLLVSLPLVLLLSVL